MINPESVFHFYIQKLECHGRCFETTWTVDPKLPYFEGHFPELPVLPAVAILDAILLAFKKVFPELELDEILNAKFMQPVTPGLQVKISAHRENVDLKIPLQVWNVEWQLAGGARLADIRIQLKLAT